MEHGQRILCNQAVSLETDVVVLAYVFNDIEGAARAHNFTSDDYLYLPSPEVRRIVDHSYLLNLLYWRYYWRVVKGPAVAQAYHDFLNVSFQNKRILEDHYAELMKFVTFARSENVELIVVLFPPLHDPAAGGAILAPVVKFFEDRDVNVIDLTETLKGRDTNSIIVNALDYHPNKTVHREVGDLIFQRLEASGLP